jgi:hypothetical protein
MYILKTFENGRYVAWTAGANPSNINKLIELHKLIKPGTPYLVDKA